MTNRITNHFETVGASPKTNAENKLRLRIEVSERLCEINAIVWENQFKFAKAEEPDATFALDHNWGLKHIYAKTSPPTKISSTRLANHSSGKEYQIHYESALRDLSLAELQEILSLCLYHLEET